MVAPVLFRRSSFVAWLGALLLAGCHQCPTPETAQGAYGPPPPQGYYGRPPDDARKRDDARTPAGGEASASHAAAFGPPEAVLEGKAAYYGDSLAGNRTANGDVYDPRGFTAASRTLPFGTLVRVVRVDNGRSVVVRINDRGPFGDERRIIDLSRAAAEQLDMIRAGVIDVRVEVLGQRTD